MKPVVHFAALLSCALILLLPPPPAFASAPGVGAYLLGTPRAALDLDGFSCKPGKSGEHCSRDAAADWNQTLGGAAITRLILSFKNDRLAKLTVVIAAAQFDQVLGTLKERHGPGKVNVITTKGGAGPVYSKRATWRVDGGRIVASQNGENKPAYNISKIVYSIAETDE